MPLRERDFTAAIAGHFAELGYDVFPEIELGGRRADLVALGPVDLIGIELKVRDWRHGLRQAMAYQLAADFAFVALPLRRAQEAHRARHLFDQEGIGLLAVGPRNEVRTIVAAAPSPRQLPALAEFVRARLEVTEFGNLSDMSDAGLA